MFEVSQHFVPCGRIVKAFSNAGKTERFDSNPFVHCQIQKSRKGYIETVLCLTFFF